jgi:homoserine dehydrogenase
LTGVRVAVIGLGTVGTWLLSAFQRQADRLARQHALAPVVVAVANARAGCLDRPEGLEIPTVLGVLASGGSIADLPGLRHWPTALEGLDHIDADIVLEVSASGRADGEPGFAHMRTAVGRGIPVATSNKWPVALHGVELVELARSQSVPFRAESTVMSGTPVLSTLVDGLAGATPVSVRGIVNATANFILSRMMSGASFKRALAEVQAAGLAERDPEADVEGFDAMAKPMIVAGLVFGVQLLPAEVNRTRITDITRGVIESAIRTGARIRYVGYARARRHGAGDQLRRVGT